jgi:hypothetical protein
MTNQDMIHLVQHYIKVRKGFNIRISEPNTPSQFLKLSKAYEVALAYFKAI